MYIPTNISLVDQVSPRMEEPYLGFYSIHKNIFITICNLKQ